MSAVQASLPRVYSNTTLAMGNEEHPGPIKVPVPPPPQGRNTVNLSDLHGQTSASNYVGITKKDPSGKGNTSIEVRMQAVIDRSGDNVTVKEIRAIGPFVKKDGKLTNERFKSYVITDTAGRPITDPASARSRVITMLKNDGMTLTRPEDRQRAEAGKEQRRVQGDRIRSAGATVLNAPNMDYSTTSDQPNRLRGNIPEPNRVERSGTNVKSETYKAGMQPATFTAMVVPNAVYEASLTKDGLSASTTLQIGTGFFPVTTSNDENYSQTTESHALVRTTFHPAGFYPGDANAAKWNKALSDYPTSIPEFQTSSYGSTSTIKTKHFSQNYLNIPNLLTPTIGASFNGRVIDERVEVRAGVYSEDNVINGRTNNTVLLSPYSWAQTHVKVGVGNIVKAPAPYGKVGVQAETGIYAVSSTVQLSSLLGRVDKKKLQTQDWHIVNGSVSTDRNAFLNQFSSITKPTGLNVLSESIVPSWKDRSAGVYVQVPNFAHGGTPAWEATKTKALFSVGSKQFVSLADMTGMLNRIGKDQLKYKEFKFIDSAALQELNKSVLVEVTNSKTGKNTLAFPGDAWINTGARVSIGGPGLFLPKNIKLQKAN